MAQLKPKVEWEWDYIKDGVKKFDKVGMKDGKGTLNLWDLGVVKAGNNATIDDTIQTFYIWNNKGGSEAIQTMTECQLTIRDGNYTDGSYHEGNADSPLVKNGWIWGRAFKSVKGSTSETPTEWRRIYGGSDDKTKAYMNFEALGRSESNATNSFGTQEISGGINTGKYEDDLCKNNYSKIQLRMEVPTDAEAGEVAFIARIFYSSRVV